MPLSTVCYPAINRVINIKNNIKYLLLRGYSELAQFLFLTHYYRLLWTKFNVFYILASDVKYSCTTYPLGTKLEIAPLQP